MLSPAGDSLGTAEGNDTAPTSEEKQNEDAFDGGEYHEEKYTENRDNERAENVDLSTIDVLRGCRSPVIE